MPTLVNYTAPNYFEGKLENFLTCLNLSLYLKEKFLNDDGVECFTKLSLEAIHKVLIAGGAIIDIFLLIDEMPKILEMPYPAAEKIREVLLDIIPRIMMIFQMNNHWQGWTELDHEMKVLKSFGELKKFR